MSSGSFDEMQHEVSEIVYLGFPMSAMLAQLHDDAIKKKDLSDVDKALICERIAEVCEWLFVCIGLMCLVQADQCLFDGSNESIQLLDVAAFIMRRLTKFSATVDSLSASNH